MLPALAITNELRKLLGLPLWGANCAAGMLMLQFGARRQRRTRSGDLVEVGELALHVQCRWRFASADEILIGAADHICNDDDDNTDEVIFAIQSLLSSHPNVAELVWVRGSAFSLGLDTGVHFEVFPSPRLSHDREFWRMLSPSPTSPHFVVTSAGIE
jgi:hypothetical protein